MITTFRCPICKRRNTALLIKSASSFQPVIYLYPEEHICFHICDKIKIEICNEYIEIASYYGTYSRDAINKLKEIVKKIEDLASSRDEELGKMIREGEELIKKAKNECANLENNSSLYYKCLVEKGIDDGRQKIIDALTRFYFKEE
ncbi:hypothetical protein V6M85_07145 [Sulfolobus tengchongensis]|uniref:Uncharacterized protein n=1 Tax=Sulfolobus tengchongensis TaxID=207809 RepID=A0AAX4KWK4_9CREN